MEENKKINWYIGHMEKTVNYLNQNKDKIDFVIEVLDARLPIGSSNSNLIKIFDNKQIIKIALKGDLINEKNKLKNYFYASIKDKKDWKRIIDYIEKSIITTKVNMMQKGLRKPILVGMVVGLPNVGKSALINFLVNKKLLDVANKPGVTKNTNIVKINNSLYLFDTPGIFLKNVDSYTLGLNLALINCVNLNVVDKKDLILHLFSILIKNKKTDYLSVLFKEKQNEIKTIKEPNQLLEYLLNKLYFNILEKANTLNQFYEYVIKKIIEDENHKLYFEP